MRFNRHHVNFPRTIHNSQPQLSQIRNHQGLIVPMELDMHEALHAEVAIVPPMSYHMAQRAFRGFMDYGFGINYLNNIGNLQKGIEEAMEHPKASDLEISIGRLTLAALDMQKPFIRDGLIPQDRLRGRR